MLDHIKIMERAILSDFRLFPSILPLACIYYMCFICDICCILKVVCLFVCYLLLPSKRDNSLSESDSRDFGFELNDDDLCTIGRVLLG